MARFASLPVFLLMFLLASSAFAQDDLAREKQLSAQYLAEMAKEPGAQVIDSGIVLRPIFDSVSGIFAGAEDVVRVSYLLSDREGKLIEESLTGDALAEFPLNRLIACWK